MPKFLLHGETDGEQVNKNVLVGQVIRHKIRQGEGTENGERVVF